MSNIIKNKDDLILLKDIVTYTKSHELTTSYLEDILKHLLPRDGDKLLTDYYIKESGNLTGMFVPDSNKILLSLDNMNVWLDRQVDDFCEEYQISDKNEFKSYMLLFVLTHEIEHAYQFLIGKGIVSAPNDVLKKAYLGLFELLAKKHYILPQPVTLTRRMISKILYKAKENQYLLERNANILSMELVSQSALFNGNEEIYKAFDDMMRTYLVCGYTNGNIGSIEETYHDIHMYNKYRKFYHDIEIDDKDKVRYGFGINDEIREKILKRKMDI